MNERLLSRHSRGFIAFTADIKEVQLRREAGLQLKVSAGTRRETEWAGVLTRR